MWGFKFILKGVPLKIYDHRSPTSNNDGLVLSFMAYVFKPKGNFFTYIIVIFLGTAVATILSTLHH